MGILGTVATGLLTFFYNFFGDVFPKTQRRLDHLEVTLQNQVEISQDIRKDLREIKKGQNEIYRILIERR